MKRYIRSGYTGEPDPAGIYEGDARFLSTINSLEDACDQFERIQDRYGDDPDRVLLEIEEFYDHYRKFRNSPHWKYIEEAYKQWHEDFDELYNYEERFFCQSTRSRKRYIRASEDYKLPSGWEEKTDKELINLGYDMSDEFKKEDEETCRRNEVTLLGYAVNDDEEFALIVRDNATRKVMVCESQDGRLYPIED